MVSASSLPTVEISEMGRKADIASRVISGRIPGSSVLLDTSVAPTTAIDSPPSPVTTSRKIF